MKKMIQFICSVAGFALFAFLALVEINNVAHFYDTTGMEGFISFIQQYGALIIVGVLVFANFLGKTIAKIALVVVFLVIGLLYALSTFAPDLVAKLFGIAKDAAGGAGGGDPVEPVAALLRMMF